VVITHPHDDDVRGFDARWGFQDLPFDPRRAMFVRLVDLQAAFCTQLLHEQYHAKSTT
jgi:hypothetical protein